MVCCLMLVFSVSGAAQGKYNASVQHYSERDGLSNNNVYAIEKDGRGVIWIGTQYGLNRFDGQQFRVFTAGDGLKKNAVHRIIRADEAHLFLVYKENNALFTVDDVEAFNIYDYQASSLADHFPDAPFSFDGVSNIMDISSHLYFELKDKRKFLYHSEEGFSDLSSLQNRVYGLRPDAYYWTLKRLEKTYYLQKQNKKGEVLGKLVFPNDDIRCGFRWLYETEKGSVFLKVDKPDNSEEAIYLIAPDMTIMQQTPVSVNGDFFMSQAQYNPLMDAYWLTGRSTGILQDIDGNVLLEVENKNRFFINSYQNLYEKNIIWQCSSSGLYKINIQAQAFQSLFGENDKEGFRAITKVKGKIYYSDGLSLSTLNEQGNRQVTPILSLAACTTPDGIIWTGNSNVIFRFDPETNDIQSYPASYGELWSIYVDRFDRVWMSCYGLNYLDDDTRTQKVVNYNGFEELASKTIYYFYPLGNDKVWLCSTSGLYVLDLVKKEITERYWSGGAGKYALPADDFRHLYEDKSTGEFWLATGQKGLVRWDPQANESQVFDFRQRLTNTTHSVHADDYGFLWLSTENGIVQFNREAFQHRIYTTKDGLQTNEFNRLSYFQDTDGRLYFGSMKDVITFHPKDFADDFEENLSLQPFVVEVRQYLGSSNTVEDVTVDFQRQKRIHVHPSDRFFRLTVGLADYKWADDAAYYYQIKGYDQSWTKSESNQITFGRLPYGKQTIAIKALLSNGQFSDAVLEVPVAVQRPFFLQWWFYLTIFLAIAAIVYWRINDLEQRNLVLEDEVRRRTHTIEEQANELKKLDELKSRFFANISHELRTPLTLILSPSQKLMKETATDKKIFPLAHSVARNSRKLLLLINEILDLTKLEAEGLKVEESTTALHPFIRQTAGMFQSHAERQRIHLSVHYELSPHIRLLLDVSKLETILNNLISNALKFTPAGGEVSLTVNKLEDKLNILVKDTGRGIHADDLPHIFDRYYQSKTNTAAEGGAGIGLALSAELVKLMKGKLLARSEVNQGTTFQLLLPWREAPPETAEQVGEKPLAAFTPLPDIAPAANTINEDLPTILFVEDNLDVQDYVAALLDRLYNIIVVNNGREALDYLRGAKEAPDLIISDLMMPVMDGYAFLENIKQSPEFKNIPVIMLTARAGLQDRLKALRIGVDDYLLKPFVEDELKARLSNLLNNAAERAAARQEARAADPPGEAPSEGDEWLAQLQDYIRKEMGSPTFSVESTAQAFGQDRFSLNRKLRELVGMSAGKYLLEVRLHAARTLLEKRGVKTVKEAAAGAGFFDTKTFSRHFLQRFGVYPSSYLK